jgi:phage terminase large subunit-like protein
LRPFASAGDKDARIRSVLQPELNKGAIYSLPAFAGLVNEELKSFPQSRKKDIVDCLSIAISNRIRPESVEERELSLKAKKKFAHRTSNITGY